MRLYLIDGSSYIYRAFHAIRNLTNSKGFPTNAIYGFTNMLLKVIREKKPDAVVIAYDAPGPTERHELYEDYKAHRPPMPDDLAAQIPSIKEVVKGFRIPTFEMPGHEADDIIGALAKKSAAEGAEVFILSGDKDMMQLVGKGVRIYDPMKDMVIDDAAVVERFGLPPERVTEVMALTGDAVDNIPGVKGIGEKTAKDLLREAGSLDELLEHPERIKSERHKRMITEGREAIILSRTLATINTDLPLDVTTEELTLKEPDWPKLLDLFTEFEFKSLLKLVPNQDYRQKGEYRLITTKEELEEFLRV